MHAGSAQDIARRTQQACGQQRTPLSAYPTAHPHNQNFLYPHWYATAVKMHNSCRTPLQISFSMGASRNDCCAHKGQGGCCAGKITQ